MKCVILCGGKGYRLREETEFRPKPMVPIGGEPIVWHIMNTLRRSGIEEFWLLTGYKGEMIREWQWEFASPVSVNILDTGEETATGGRLYRARDALASPFLLTYGDGVANIDLARLQKFHHPKWSHLTITSVKPPSRFGVIRSDAWGVVSRFNEKAKSPQRINGGFMVCETAVFDYLSGRDDEAFEQEPMTRMVKEEKVRAYRHNGFWQCMDTYAEYLLLNKLCENGKAPWTV